MSGRDSIVYRRCSNYLHAQSFEEYECSFSKHSSPVTRVSMQTIVSHPPQRLQWLCLLTSHIDLGHAQHSLFAFLAQHCLISMAATPDSSPDDLDPNRLRFPKIDTTFRANRMMKKTTARSGGGRTACLARRRLCAPARILFIPSQYCQIRLKRRRQCLHRDNAKDLHCKCSFTSSLCRLPYRPSDSSEE